MTTTNTTRATAWMTATTRMSAHVGATFRAGAYRLVAERAGDAWAILSGLHGLLSPSTVVAPYNVAVPTMRKAERAAWASRVVEQIRAEAGALRTRFVLVAGGAYRAAFEALNASGSSAVAWDCPVAGMQIGEMRSWLASAQEGA